MTYRKEEHRQRPQHHERKEQADDGRWTPCRRLEDVMDLGPRAVSHRAGAGGGGGVVRQGEFEHACGPKGGGSAEGGYDHAGRQGAGRGAQLDGYILGRLSIPQIEPLARGDECTWVKGNEMDIRCPGYGAGRIVESGLVEGTHQFKLGLAPLLDGKGKRGLETRGRIRQRKVRLVRTLSPTSLDRREADLKGVGRGEREGRGDGFGLGEARMQSRSAATTTIIIITQIAFHQRLRGE